MKVGSSQYNFAYGDQIHFPYSVASVIAAARAAGVEMELRPAAVQRELFEGHIRRFADCDVLLCSCYVWNWEITNRLAAAVKAVNPDCVVVFGGPQVPDEPGAKWYAEHPWVEACVHGEGEAILTALLVDVGKGGTVVVQRPGISQRTEPHSIAKAARLHLDDLPSPYLDGTIDELSEPLLPGRRWIAAWETNRGCPFSCSFCLAGDTIVNTVYGKIPIRELAESYVEVGVFTYDRNMRRASVATAQNIRRTGIAKQLVRVHFDDGSHIDCTPDHRFLAFRWGNQFVSEREWVIEAQYLEPGTRVRALWEGMSGEYPTVAWSRKGRIHHHVVAVEPLPGFHDVYCLEVPNIGWFYANNVLVHNCDWGSATYTKLRQFPLSRLVAEAEWFGQHQIPYVDCCDANFGILPRDRDLAHALRLVKERYGYPQTFRQSWTKNSTTKVIDIAKELQAVGLLTAVGLALESLDEPTLKTIERRNLPFGRYADLSREFADAGLPTYTELIRGLPGETLESFKAGLGALINAAHIGQIYIYNCAVLPNAPMADSAYMAEHRIETVRSPIYLAHSAVGSRNVPEYEEIVVATAMMSRSAMEQAFLYSWAVQLGECLGLCDQLSSWYAIEHRCSRMEFYDQWLGHFRGNAWRTVIGNEIHEVYVYLRKGYEGYGWDDVDRELGALYWPIEEASWLRLVGLRRAETQIALCGFMRSLYHPEPERAVREQMDSLAVYDERDGRDFPTWARDIMWYGRRAGRFRVAATREAA